MNIKRQIAVILVLVLMLLMSGCVTAKVIEPAASPTPTPTLAPTPTPSPTPDPKVLTLKAPAALLELLDTWNDKYVIFINSGTDIKTLEDLNGKNIFCDMYSFGMETAVSDMSAFNTAAGIEMAIGLGNNIPQFYDQMAGDKNMLGFLPKEVADSNSIQDSPDLKVVVFE